MAKEVPIYCVRCGRHIGWQKVPGNFQGNCLWGYCERCRMHGEIIKKAAEILEDIDRFLKAWLEYSKLPPEVARRVKCALERVENMPTKTHEQRVERVVEFLKALTEQEGGRDG